MGIYLDKKKFTIRSVQKMYKNIAFWNELMIIVGESDDCCCL